jgi:hypothetical protein
MKVGGLIWQKMCDNTNDVLLASPCRCAERVGAVL